MIVIASSALFLTLTVVIQPFGDSALVAVKEIPAGEIISEDAVEPRDRLSLVPPDAAKEPDLVVGKRSRVDIEPETIIRTAYVAIAEQSKERRDTVALPVITDVAALFTEGDTLDIYTPSQCADDTQNCPATLLSGNAKVKQVLRPEENQWSTTQTATLILAIDPKDTSVVAGVTDPAAVTIVKTEHQGN